MTRPNHKVSNTLILLCLTTLLASSWLLYEQTVRLLDGVIIQGHPAAVLEPHWTHRHPDSCKAKQEWLSSLELTEWFATTDPCKWYGLWDELLVIVTLWGGYALIKTGWTNKRDKLEAYLNKQSDIRSNP